MGSIISGYLDRTINGTDAYILIGMTENDARYYIKNTEIYYNGYRIYELRIVNNTTSLTSTICNNSRLNAKLENDIIAELVGCY